MNPFFFRNGLESSSVKPIFPIGNQVEQFDLLLDLIPKNKFSFAILDFYKIGGYRLLVPLLGSSYAFFRAGAANLIAEMAQNNTFSQEMLKEWKVLEVILKMLDHDPDESARRKALFAISALIRQNIELERQFDEMDGMSYLMRAIQNNGEQLQTKAAFLMCYLFNQRSESHVGKYFIIL